MAAVTTSRADRFTTLTNTALLRIIQAGALTAAAAHAELRRRGLIAVQTRKGWFLAPAIPFDYRASEMRESYTLSTPRRLAKRPTAR